jgi:hypothetical protein
MAGLCSASEETDELTGSSSTRENDERSRLGGARHRCPYGTPDTNAVVDVVWSGGYRTVYTATLHCERLWVEATS